MRIKSFAKINLGLEVGEKRGDGYHEIKTLFQSIDFYDILEFHPDSCGKILLIGDDDEIPWGEGNLIYRAAALLKERLMVNEGITIRVSKNIPSGRGLGGGSSNAAMTLYALNKIWRLGLERKEVMDLSRQIGSDVAYILQGGLCMGSGRGNDVRCLKDFPPLFCLLILPGVSILTASVYERYQLSLTSSGKESKIIGFLRSRNLSVLENSLEETIFKLYPQIKAFKSLLHNAGAELSLVSGTGSAVFGLFLEKEKAKKAFEEIRKEHSSLLVETVAREFYWNNLGAGV